MAKDTNWILWGLGILVIAYFLNIGGLKDAVSGGGGGVTVSTSTGVPYISTGATNLSFIGSDALESGTSIPLTAYVSTNGGTYSSTVYSASPGNTLNLLFAANNETWHAVYLPSTVVKTVPQQTFEAKLLRNASITMTVFTTDGDLLTEPWRTDRASIATANQKNQTVTAGSSYNLKVRMDGQDKKSTNPMRCVLESTNGTSMKTMTLSGFGAKFVGKEKPSSYTLNSSNSEVWSFDVDAITGAVSPEGTIGVVSESGMSLAGSRFTMHCFSKENFIDTDSGQVVEGGVEDSKGTLKSYAHVYFTGNFAS